AATPRLVGAWGGRAGAIPAAATLCPVPAQADDVVEPFLAGRELQCAIRRPSVSAGELGDRSAKGPGAGGRLGSIGVNHGSVRLSNRSQGRLPLPTVGVRPSLRYNLMAYSYF